MCVYYRGGHEGGGDRGREHGGEERPDECPYIRGGYTYKTPTHTYFRGAYTYVNPYIDVSGGEMYVYQ